MGRFRRRNAHGPYSATVRALGNVPVITACFRVWLEVLRNPIGKPVPIRVESLDFFIPVSDGEGTGSVASGLWMPRNPAFQTQKPGGCHGNKNALMTSLTSRR